MVKVFLALGIAILISGLSLAYYFQTPPREEAIETEPIEFTLTEREIRQDFEITSQSSVPTYQFSAIMGPDLEKVKTWRYETGSIVHYHSSEKEESKFYVLVSRFEDVIGAKVAFDSITTLYPHRIEEVPVIKIGRESRSLERGRDSRNILFRNSNILVYIMGDIRTIEMEMYAKIIEGKIRESLQADQYPF